METLVVVSQHRNQYYTKYKSQNYTQFGSSSPSSNFRGINCRTFQTGSGILPTPLKSSTTTTTTSPLPETKLKTPLTTPISSTDSKTFSKVVPSSAPVPINDKGCKKERTFVDPKESFLLSELWAGPTYSNSPPPSSLPIPKFSVRPKRTVSLDLPGSCLPEIEMRKIANSAPCSPRQENSPFGSDFLVNSDFATKNLCRILNLNLDDYE